MVELLFPLSTLLGWGSSHLAAGQLGWRGAPQAAGQLATPVGLIVRGVGHIFQVLRKLVYFHSNACVSKKSVPFYFQYRQYFINGY
jgi:hypothetical protein